MSHPFLPCSVLRFLPAILLAGLPLWPQGAVAQEQPGDRDFHGDCGDTVTLYTHPETAAAQTLVFRIRNSGKCVLTVIFGPPGGPFNVAAGGSLQADPPQTHDIMIPLNPRDLVRVVCRIIVEKGKCKGQWTLSTVSGWGITEQNCGSDQDIFVNATAVVQEVSYVVCNRGKCQLSGFCNDRPLVAPGVGPVVIQPGDCTVVSCRVNPGGVIAFRCGNEVAGVCRAKYQRAP